MLEDSGLLHEEPPKFFPDLQTTTQTKPCMPKSSSQSKTSKTPTKRTAFVKGSKQILTSALSSTSSNQAQSSTERSPNVNKVKPLILTLHYSGTCALRTPWDQPKVSGLLRCPDY